MDSSESHHADDINEIKETIVYSLIIIFVTISMHVWYKGVPQFLVNFLFASERNAFQAVENKKDNFSKNITQLLLEGERTLDDFRQKIEHKNVVVLLGSTKSGKSTLISYLIGTDLEAYETALKDLKIREAGISFGPKIGCSSMPETTVPGAFHMLDDMVIVDCPAFGNAINSMIINQIKYASTAKFVLVVDFNDVKNDNVGIFENSIKQAQTFLWDCLSARPGFSFIFTKVKNRVSPSTILEMLRHKVDSKLSHYTINEDLIGIFNEPLEVGRIVTNLEVNVRTAIQQTETITMSNHQMDVSPSIDTKQLLQEIRAMIFHDTRFFHAEIDSTLKGFNQFSKEQWAYASFEDELNQAKTSLESLKAFAKLQLNKRRDSMSDIQKSLETLLGTAMSTSFAKKFKPVILLDQSWLLEDQYAIKLKTMYNSALTELLNEKIPKVLAPIDKELKLRKQKNIEFTSKMSSLDVSKCVAYGLFRKTMNTSLLTTSLSTFLGEDESTEVDVADSIEATDVVDTADDATDEVVEEGPGFASKFLGAVVGVLNLGPGTAASAYMVYKEIYSKRMEVRKRQKRSPFAESEQ